jgi:magnesium transporter
MIQYFTVENGRLVALQGFEGATVLRLVAPDAGEIERVAAVTAAPPELLTAACDKDERPRFESDDGTHLLVLRVPHEITGSDVPVVTVALGIVATRTHLISVCSVESSVWGALDAGKTRLHPANDRLPFLCALLLCVARLYLKHLDFIRVEADRVEREIHHSMRNEMLIRMLNLEKCLVYFTTSLRGHDPIWARLRRLKTGDLTEEEQELIDDVQIEFKQAHDLAEIHSNILTGMMDAFASVISNNLNVVMKFLTSITIIMMLPTLVASVYGMNVPLPFQHSPHAFLITMVMSLVLSVLGVVLFLRKKFF